VEKLWMDGEFPVDGSSAKIFFGTMSLSRIRGDCGVRVFVTRFA
jgi:hypothetical protein